MRAILRFLTSRGLWIFLGVLAIILIIWFLGPLISVGKYRPLASVVVRAILCAAIVVIWLGRFAYRKHKEARQNALLLAEIKASSQESLLDVDREEDSELTRQFSEMTNLLKKTKFAKKGSSGLTKAISGQYLYQMPWYLFLGASGSGKTTAVKNSGLNFPLAGEFGLATQGIGGTKNCDWLFSDEAVLLDTAGRYVSQDSNRNQDEKDWSEFLSLLKNYRPKQPVNGVVLTVSVEDLLQDSGEQIRLQVVNIRKRLQELREKTNINFPVYLMVTKTDLISGFDQYFSSLLDKERKQVWGFTLPFKGIEDQSGLDVDSFDKEYGLLVDRLNKGLPKLVQSLDTVDERAEVYLFPQEFLNLQEKLSAFTREVFKTSKYELNVTLRGVYFTSATQTGNELNPIADAIKNQLNLQNKYVDNNPLVKERRSFFLTDLFDKVIFPEANLASINKKWFRTQAFLYFSGLAALGLITLLALGLLTNSYFNNEAYLESVGRNAKELSVKLEQQKEPPDLFGVLEILDKVKLLSKTPEVPDVNKAKWTYHFGLYQGYDVDKVVLSTYRKILQDNVLPTVASEIDEDLRKASEDDPDYIYEALKAYLMMYDKDKYNDKFIQSWLLFNIEKKQAGELSSGQIQSLEGHLTALFSGRSFTSPLAYDGELVEQKRMVIARDPLSIRMYNRIKKLMALEEGGASVSFAQMGGPQAPLIFRRASNKPLTEGISKNFTVDSYRGSFNKLLAQELVNLFDSEKWVLGSFASVASVEDKVRITKEVQGLYFNDYINEWKNYIQDLRIKQPTNLRESIQIARLLSEQNSPLVLMIEGISRNTNLESKNIKAATDVAAKQADKAANRAVDRTNMRQLLGNNTPQAGQAVATIAQPEKMVSDQFVGFHQLTFAAEGKPAAINEVIQSINDLYVYLVSAQVAIDKGVDLPPEDALIKYKADIDRLPEPFRTQLDQFSAVTGKSITSESNSKLVDTVAKGAENVTASCADLKKQGYPFVRGSQQEASLDDFAAVFSVNGSYGTYYKEKVQNQTILMDSSIVQNDASAQKLLSTFQNAEEIRKMYFQNGGARPTISFEIKVVKLDDKADSVRLSVGNQILMYEHGPQTPIVFKWPGEGKEDQVRLQFSPLEEKGQASAVTYTGAWALFRLFENAKITPGYTPNSALASITLAKRNVVFEITSKSRHSPFILNKLRDFKCS